MTVPLTMKNGLLLNFGSVKTEPYSFFNYTPIINAVFPIIIFNYIFFHIIRNDTEVVPYC